MWRPARHLATQPLQEVEMPTLKLKTHPTIVNRDASRAEITAAVVETILDAGESVSFACDWRLYVCRLYVCRLQSAITPCAFLVGDAVTFSLLLSIHFGT